MGRSALRRTPDSALSGPESAKSEADPADSGAVGAKKSASTNKRRAPKPSATAKPAAKAPAKPEKKAAARSTPVKARTSGAKSGKGGAQTAKPAAKAKPSRSESKTSGPKTVEPAPRTARAAGKPAAPMAPKRGAKPAARPARASTAPSAKAVDAPAQAPSPRPAAAADRAPDAGASAPPRDDASINPFLSPEVETFAANMARLWEAGGKAMAAYIGPRERGEKKVGGAEIVEIAKTLGQVVEKWASDPDRVLSAQRDFAAGFVELWAGTLKRLSGEAATPVVPPDPKDGRFKDPEWTEHPVFDFLRQAYLHSAKLANRVVDDVEDLDPQLRHKASFYVKLLSNAVSPSNFLPTNPELIRETIASKGENLVRGMTMLAEDIAAGGGDLRIRQTDGSGFEVGRNLATTPGKVVFRNEVFELIQYAPATELARTRPVLIVPPWINKFYVLDLTPEKSMIRWMVEQGLTVFCISWVNPDARHAHMSFDAYMRDGIMKAVDVARDICGTDSVDTIGYCVGGTLLAVTAAYMAKTGDRRVASVTLMATQVDFTYAGDLKVFADEEQIQAVEAKMAEQGYLEGAGMANAFNLIRSNDMIFPYLVNNYLKGKAPFPFDLLYWNSDATRMPAANHSFYLRSCYLNNELARGRMEICGETLDLAKVTIPVYELATREDHIAPPKSVYLGAQLFGGPVRFVLAGSGHIAGVVNPPAKMKYNYRVGGEPKGELQHWLDRSEEKPGSWWPDWRAWIASLDATMVPARIPGEGKYEALCDAPGTYVKARS